MKWPKSGLQCKQRHLKTRDKKTGDTAAATLVFVASCTSLKFLTDDHSDFVAV